MRLLLALLTILIAPSTAKAFPFDHLQHWRAKMEKDKQQSDQKQNEKPETKKDGSK
jgi:hypothetical protein